MSNTVSKCVIFLCSIALLISTAYADGMFAYPFIGKWVPSQPSITLDQYDYQDIQNMRPDGKRLRGVRGHTIVTDNPLTNSRVAGMFHYRKYDPASETHLLAYVDIGGTGAGYYLYDNTTAIGDGSVGDFGNYLYANIPDTASTTLHGMMSIAPQEALIISDGDQTRVWGGTYSSPLRVFLADDWIVNDPNVFDYTEELTSSASSTSALFGTGGDDDDALSLLHMDGTPGATTFTEDGATSRTWTASGDANTSDDYAVFGDTSLEVDGSGDYVTAPDHADWDFDSGDFTVDFWARTRHPSTQGVIWSQKTDNDNMVYFRRSDSATNTYQFVMRTGGADTIDLSAAAGLGWNHWAIVRNDNTWYLFCNGVSKDTATNATDYPDLTGVMYLGSGNIGGTDYRFNGYIDEFRVSKGVARWTSDFTVPTEAYTETERLYMIIGSPHILSGVYFDVEAANADTSTISGYRYTDDRWTGQVFTDGTSSGSVSMAQDGWVTWTQDDDVTTLFEEYDLYWYQFKISAGTATVAQVMTTYDPQPITNIWDGDPSPISAFVWYDHSGTAYLDDGYTTYMQDDDPTTLVALDSMQTTDFLYLGFAEPQRGIKIYVVDQKGNSTTATTGKVEYYGYTGWVEVEDLEGEVVATVGLSKTDYTWWAKIPPGVETEYTLDYGEKAGVPLYYYRVSFPGAALDAETEIYYITGVRSPPQVGDYTFSTTFANRTWLFGEVGSPGNTARYSTSNTSYVWNGEDSGTLTFGNGGVITAAHPLYNVFQSTGYYQLIVTTPNETYRVLGDAPSNWEINLISSVVGCTAPRSMTMCDVHHTPDQPPRQVLVWVTAHGVVMCDGATIRLISDDIRMYWDENHTSYISSAAREQAVGWFNPNIRAYKLLIGGVELEYGFESRSWTKLYREDSSGADPLTAGCRVTDANGAVFTYGMNDDSELFHLEKGGQWRGATDITQYVHTKDMMLDDAHPMFLDTRIDWIRLLFDDRPGADDITFTHYCEGSATINGTDEQAVPDSTTTALGPFYTTDVNLGPCHYHSFKISSTTGELDGLGLNGFGMVYESEDMISQ
jgi:hypothetical protein